VYGYINYEPSQTLVNYGGWIVYQLGGIDYASSYWNYYKTGLTNAFVTTSASSLQPLNTQSSSYYIYNINVGVNLIEYSFSDPTVEKITLSGNILNNINEINGLAIINYTWTYSINGISGTNPIFGIKPYANGFVDNSPASIAMFENQTSPYTAYLPIYFENYVVTSRTYSLFQEHCILPTTTTQTIWVDTYFYFYVQLGSSNVANVVSSPHFIPSSSTPPNSYITGISSETHYGYPLCAK
jgi:hypothetical protein